VVIADAGPTYGVDGAVIGVDGAAAVVDAGVREAPVSVVDAGAAADTAAAGDVPVTVPSQTDAPVAVKGGSVQGGGCKCTTLGAGSARPAGAWLAFVALALGASLRRRRRRRRK
jgi:hypothetical protein